MYKSQLESWGRWLARRTCNAQKPTQPTYSTRLSALNTVLNAKREQAGGGLSGSIEQAAASCMFSTAHHIQKVSKILLCILQAHVG